MSKQIKNQYDSFYSLKGSMYEDNGPLEIVTRLIDYIDKGKVLDIGGGEGRNALYLAEQGFEVTVTDLSGVGLDKLQSFAKEKNLNIATKASDVLVEEIKGKYDAVILTSILHHMNEEEARRIVVKAQDCTNKGGFNIIVTFSNQGGLYERNVKSNSGRFYPDEETFKEMYAGWEIEQLGTHETTSLARDKEGNQMKNDVATLLARK